MLKDSHRHVHVVFALAVLCAALGTDSLTRADARPPERKGNCSELDKFQDTFTRNLFGDITLPTDANGNAVSGKTVFLPTPGDGSGAPASASVTLTTDQPFFVPLFQLFGTGYNNGTPDDPFVDANVFKTLDITFKVDGKTVIDRKNALRFYSKFEFDPVIAVDFSPIDSVIWLQGVGYASRPLRAGHHTLSLHVKNTLPVFGGQFIEFTNSWDLTVLPGKTGHCGHHG